MSRLREPDLVLEFGGSELEDKARKEPGRMPAYPGEGQDRHNPGARGRSFGLTAQVGGYDSSSTRHSSISAIRYLSPSRGVTSLVISRSAACASPKQP